MNNSVATKLSGVFSALLMAIIWSGWIVISKWGMSQTLTEWDIIAIRFLTAAILVTPFYFIWRSKIASIFSWQVISCSLACGTLYLTTNFIGLNQASAANAGLVVNGALPIMSAVILFFWRGSWLNHFQIIGIFLILAAAFILTKSNTQSSPASFLWFILSCFFLGFYSVAIKLWQLNIATIMVAVPILNTIFYLPIWLFLPSNLTSSSWQELALQSVYQGIIVSVLALFLMSYSIKALGSVGFSTVLAIVPAGAAIFSYLFLGENISELMWVSILICTMGIISYSSLEPIVKWLQAKVSE